MGESNEDMFSGIPFGLWNLLYISIMCLNQASAPAQYYSSIFANIPVDFRCSTNVTGEKNITFDNYCHVTSANIDSGEYNESLNNCTTYEFDTSQVSSTFISEFQLVCDKAWIASMFVMIFPIGSFIGTFFLGASDKWGRVTVIKISSTIHVAGILFVGLARHVYLVLLGRFFIGLTFPIFIGAGIPLSLESVSPKHRSTVSFMIMLPFYAFVMLLGILAYFIREWRMLYLITSIPMFPVPIIALFLDKSPRWLIQQGRVDEAYMVMQKAAKMNKGTVDFDLTFIKMELSNNSDEHNSASNSIFRTTATIKTLMSQLYGTTYMLKLSFAIPTLWFLSAIVYFGVPLNANNFTNNPYLYMIMIGAAELPAALLGPLLIKYFGNIKTGISLFLITGCCMLGTLLVTDNLWWIKWIFAILTMTCSGIIIGKCSLLTSEMFPTVVRSTGYGMSFAAYYLGFFLSSLISNMKIVSETWWAFNTICGVCCVLGAVIISFLPETHGQILCETTNQANDRKLPESKSKYMKVNMGDETELSHVQS
ncbi:unnamed protein product [Meganyctiphanes norvegica]|uniref:Major facilitator superfamily (MFS) profile domain-containing protein n=1 Tax=Meganyctiphanes norvegica TaxID=48144 RepID=A0AAV2RLV9_MEGNR